MLHVEFSTVNFLIALGTSHLVNLFMGWFVHFLQHQEILWIRLYQVHLKTHHEINANQTTTEDYLKMGLGHGLWLALFLGGFALYYLLLPTWMTATFIGNAVFLMAFVYYVHWEYDKPASRLNRFKWFQQGRALHRIHHSYFGEAFSKSKNYAFGGPFAGNLIDRLMGTFQGQSASEGATYVPRPVRLLPIREASSNP